MDEQMVAIVVWGLILTVTLLSLVRAERRVAEVDRAINDSRRNAVGATSGVRTDPSRTV